MTPSQRRELRATAAFVVGAALVADQLTKTLATAVDHGSILPVRNDELALGIADGPGWLLSILMVTALVLFGRFTFRLAAAGHLPAWVPGLLIGGAAGNIVDRLRFGSVRDFFVVGSVVLNVADLALLAGVGACLWLRLVRPPLRVVTDI